MLKKSTLLHLRIPFSYYLLPVFIFALSQAARPFTFDALLVFASLHFFLYPASNGFNSYFDKDTESIGGLENPPPVSRELYFTSLALDGAALLLGLFINLQFTVMALVYGLVSKTYSHPAVRLKKMPYASWLTAGIFQGFFTFMMVLSGVDGPAAWTERNLWAGALTSLLLLGSYPMTQVYQHREDSRRGDITLSLKLGVRGTFIFTALVFGLANLAFLFFFVRHYNYQTALLFEALLAPVLAYFFYWFAQVRTDSTKADFRSTMRLNLISATCMNIFFLALLWAGN